MDDLSPSNASGPVADLRFSPGLDTYLLRFLAARSPLIMHQIECLVGTKAQELPANVFVWLEAALLTCADLRATDNVKLVQYLNVRLICSLDCIEVPRLASTCVQGSQLSSIEAKPHEL